MASDMLLAELSKRGFVQQCTDIQGLEKKLAEGSLALYAGFDPTGPSLHVGHMVPLFAMAHFAKAGHRVVALGGGGTARIGDPSGKTEMRKMLDAETFSANAKSIEKQIRNFFDSVGVPAQNIVVLNNADWLLGLNYIDFLREIGTHFSVNRMLTFESYRQRMETGLSFIEFNYQLLQSYDFHILYRDHGVSLQLGGDDQWGNIVAGIDLIRRLGGGETYGLTFPLITRNDGKKMGKSEKGSVFLDPALTPVFDLYQYWRNTPDEDVDRFLRLFSFLPLDELEVRIAADDINSRKELLALGYTAIIHGSEQANAAMATAKSLFGKGSVDTSALETLEIPTVDIEAGIPAADLFARTSLCASKSEARRLIAQGGAFVNDKPVGDAEQLVGRESIQGNEVILRAGKKHWFRILAV